MRPFSDSVIGQRLVDPPPLVNPRRSRGRVGIVDVYAHGCLLSEFLNPRTDTRSDACGGTLGNRLRIARELIEKTQEAVAATRFSVDPTDPETYEAFALLSDLPDLWDLPVPDNHVKTGHSHFVNEGAPTGAVAPARALTGKAVDAGHVAIDDDDHCYSGPVLALELCRRGHAVTPSIPEGHAGAWGAYNKKIMDPAAAPIASGVSHIIKLAVKRTSYSLKASILVLLEHYSIRPATRPCRTPGVFRTLILMMRLSPGKARWTRPASAA